MKHYRIELLQTAEGMNLKKDKTEDTVIILLWADNLKQAKKFAEKIAEALYVSTHVGGLEYVIKSVKLYKKPEFI